MVVVNFVYEIATAINLQTLLSKMSKRSVESWSMYTENSKIFKYKEGRKINF